MSFCGFVKDPALRYDLRQGAASRHRRRRRPACLGRVHPVARRHGARRSRVPRGLRRLRAARRLPLVRRVWLPGARAPRRTGGASVRRGAREPRVQGGLARAITAATTRSPASPCRSRATCPSRTSTFDEKFAQFRVDGPGADTISIRHHFGLPEIDARRAGEAGLPQAAVGHLPQGRLVGLPGHLARRGRPLPPPRGRLQRRPHPRPHLQRGITEEMWRQGGFDSLTLFPTDQILLARVLADRDACFLHSGGGRPGRRGAAVRGPLRRRQVDDHGAAAAASSASDVEILCDDRNIVRRWPDGFRVHGTWSHGDGAAGLGGLGAARRHPLRREGRGEPAGARGRPQGCRHAPPLRSSSSRSSTPTGGTRASTCWRR